MTNQRAIILLSQMYLPNFDDEEKDALTKAIEALTEQEPRVLTLDEARTALHNDTVIWVEVNGGQIFAGVRMDGADYFTVQDDSVIDVTDLDDAKCANKYGMAWRFWSSRPTDEQRRETPWERD